VGQAVTPSFVTPDLIRGPASMLEAIIPIPTEKRRMRALGQLDPRSRRSAAAPRGIFANVDARVLSYVIRFRHTARMRTTARQIAE
jgi:hypothetical protein